jgi:general secretion pathway protein L
VARRILSLDLGSHSIKAVLIESTLRSYRVLGLFQQQRDPSRALSEQIQEFCTVHGLKGDTVLSCVPGDSVTHRFLSLPFAHARHIRQAVPFELEGQIPLSLEEVVVDAQIVKNTAEGATVLAVAIPKRVLAEHLSTMTVAGLDPTTVGLAPLAPLSLLTSANRELTGVTALIEVGEQRTSVALLHDGVLRSMRTISMGLHRSDGLAALMQELHWTLLVLGGDALSLPVRFFLCGGGAYSLQLRDELQRAFSAEIIPFQHLTIPGVPETLREEQGQFATCLGLGVREILGLTAPGINLRRGEFARRGSNDLIRREWVRVGWLAASVAAAAGLAVVLELYRLNLRYQALRQEVRRVFAATLPEVQTVVNEKVQLQDAVSALQERHRLLQGPTVSSLEILRELSVALQEHVRVDLEEWTFDDEAVRLRGTTSSFEAAETIKTVAMNVGVFREVQLKDVKSQPGSEKVSFGLQMLFKQKGQEE